ncbi:Protein SRG1 [Triticum urartu]|uniref:Protein SRG1 n=1 Tax=Triticum urartu TaxID=4572 RepID=M7Z7P0_TRIUA|nr:protein SRG1-like isoform X1 [Triticum urartu]EMS59218.1 Protein SRG1 [Triticum urartu]
MEIDDDVVVTRAEITDAAEATFADSTVIPDRYARPDEVGDGVVVGGDDESHELPLVDMARLLDSESSEAETAKLGSACRHWGFFQLTNHGVDESVVQGMKDSAMQFFRLPLEKKNALAVHAGSLGGFGHHFTGSSRKLDWAESLILATQQNGQTSMNLWPADPPTFGSFFHLNIWVFFSSVTRPLLLCLLRLIRPPAYNTRDALEKYSLEMSGLTRRLLGFMASDLGVEREALDGAFRGKTQSVAMHHYPPCRHPDKVIGITPHHDGLGLALLLHVDDTPGLQVKRDGRWFPLDPLPGALVVNVGDILQVLTNGEYRSAEHRVLVDAERGRATVVMFQDASVAGTVKPLPGLGEARYREIEYGEYVKGNFRGLAEGTRFVDSLQTNRFC